MKCVASWFVLESVLASGLDQSDHVSTQSMWILFSPCSHADLLLNSGELSIYTKTKEQLAKEVAASGAASGLLSTVTRGSQGEQQQQEGRSNSSLLAEALLSGAVGAAAGDSVTGEGVVAAGEV